jgi:putative secretion ATPase (PEP-CTERM system associated)
MYNSFFGFTCKPFQLTPDPEFLFMSRVHKRALTYLNYGVADNCGFILITGEIGTGKTTVIRSLIKKIPQEIKIARINNTKVSSTQLISMINEEFGIHSSGDDKTRMLSKLTDFLINQYARGGRSMIIIDEAQNLSPNLLEEIRLLSNLETDKSKLLQIILLGQPELNALLGRPELEQLRQRIAVSTHISPLSREETEAYILHRLKVAGNEHAVIFQDGAMDEIFTFSRGIPRLVNIACDFLLLSAFADGAKTIDAALVKEVVEDLIINSPKTNTPGVKEEEPVSHEAYGAFRTTLSAIQEKLRNIEAALGEMQRGSDDVRQTRLLEEEKNKEMKKRENDLRHKEDVLHEKQEYLRKREENIKNLFEQHLKGILPVKSDSV